MRRESTLLSPSLPLSLFPHSSRISFNDFFVGRKLAGKVEFYWLAKDTEIFGHYHSSFRARPFYQRCWVLPFIPMCTFIFMQICNKIFLATSLFLPWTLSASSSCWPTLWMTAPGGVRWCWWCTAAPSGSRYRGLPSRWRRSACCRGCSCPRGRCTPEMRLEIDIHWKNATNPKGHYAI